MTTLNVSLLLLAAAPAISFDRFCRHAAVAADHKQYTALSRILPPSCETWFYCPVATVNAVLIWNVCVVFWLLSLLQRSTWLIDPYWTIIPVLVEAYYCTHPAATGSSRSRCVATLIGLWSLRLSHSYIRREEWQIGAKEDWRFADMRSRYGQHWWWLSFFLVYVSQYFMLMGLTLPLYSASFSTAPWQWQTDSLAFVVCLTGLAVAHVSDTSLHHFVATKKKLKATGQRPKQQLLQTGLWLYSRHPNHVGEQLFWWGLSLFAVSSRDYWTLVGPLFNTICMVQVTGLVEARMLQQKDRAEAYRLYQRRTAMWLPNPFTVLRHRHD